MAPKSICLVGPVCQRTNQLHPLPRAGAPRLAPALPRLVLPLHPCPSPAQCPPRRRPSSLRHPRPSPPAGPAVLAPPLVDAGARRSSARRQLLLRECPILSNIEAKQIKCPRGAVPSAQGNTCSLHLHEERVEVPMEG
ncbi:unnamed protein product [Urochloa humidicola]